FKYPETSKNSLNGVNMVFSTGKKIGIVGLSGSGKSTVVSLLMKIYSPYSGNIYINQTSIQNIDNQSWLERVAIVSNEHYIFSDSIKENILVGRTVEESQFSEVC